MPILNEGAMYVAIAGGICLIIAGITGATSMENIRDIVAENVTTDETVKDVFNWLIWIAGFGGLAVILGGVLVGYDYEGVGKFLIALGAGMGLLGFIIAIIVWAFGGGNIMGGASLIGIIGVVLSIVARQMVD